MKYFLEKRPKFFGIKLALESSGSDSKDENTTEALGYNSRGQFAPYWVHDTKNNINLHPLSNYETALWYQLILFPMPRQAGNI